MAIENAALAPPSGPEPRPLAKIHPTLLEALRTCSLIVAFREDPMFRGMARTGPSAWLGIVSHSLMQQAAEGAFDEVDRGERQSRLARVWEQEVAVAHEQMSRDWPLGQVPPPARWPGYHIIKTRLLERLEGELERRSSAPARAAMTVELETTLEAPDGPLAGRPDRVDIRDGEVRILDLKTGWSLESELRPSHRRQLLLYAYLWHAVHGSWPRMIGVAKLDGETISTEVDPQEATQVAAEAIRYLNEFNAMASSGAAVWDLGQPSAEGCRHCEFRTGCYAFARAIDKSWGWYRKTLIGSVSDIKKHGEATTLELDVLAGDVEHSGQARILGIPLASAPPLGSTASFTDLIPTRQPSDFRVDWQTRISVWNRHSAQPTPQ